ncbi:hypothetical protein Tco_1486635, partial [Tanacetum coccineum]
DFLLESARKVRLEGAVEYLDDPTMDFTRLRKNLGSTQLTRWVLLQINGKHQLSGG